MGKNFFVKQKFCITAFQLWFSQPSPICHLRTSYIHHTTTYYLRYGLAVLPSLLSIGFLAGLSGSTGLLQIYFVFISFFFILKITTFCVGLIGRDEKKFAKWEVMPVILIKLVLSSYRSFICFYYCFECWQVHGH